MTGLESPNGLDATAVFDSEEKCQACYLIRGRPSQIRCARDQISAAQLGLRYRRQQCKSVARGPSQFEIIVLYPTGDRLNSQNLICSAWPNETSVSRYIGLRSWVTGLLQISKRGTKRARLFPVVIKVSLNLNPEEL